MNLSNTAVNILLITAAVSINVALIGLIMIALVHDGSSTAIVLQTLQSLLGAAITAIGTVAGAVAMGYHLRRAKVPGAPHSATDKE